MGNTPDVDIVIAVHTVERPIERAVTSALNSTAAVRVTVVCHNVEQSAIAARLGAWKADDRVRLLELEDGIPSPAGPFNHGLDAATAPFTSVLGSDDELATGAVDSWLEIQRRHDADVVIPQLRLASGSSLRSSPTRPFRTKGLSGVRDRLAYRTAQLGLVSRDRFPRLRFTTGLRTGEDIEYGLHLWFSDALISFDRYGPAYLVHAASADRATITAKKVADDFAFLARVIDSEWANSLTANQRESVAVKLLRIHVMDAIRSRFTLGPVDETEHAALISVIERIYRFSPTAADLLSRRDGRILAGVVEGPGLTRELIADLAARTNFAHPANLISSSPAKVLHREAPLRFLAALAMTP